jgi:hypothetical protein
LHMGRVEYTRKSKKPVVTTRRNFHGTWLRVKAEE